MFDFSAWLPKHGVDVTRPCIDNVIAALKHRGAKNSLPRATASAVCRPFVQSASCCSTAHQPVSYMFDLTFGRHHQSCCCLSPQHPVGGPPHVPTLTYLDTSCHLRRNSNDPTCLFSSTLTNLARCFPRMLKLKQTGHHRWRRYQHGIV